MRIVNKKAKFNYNLFESFEAGISLLGGEVKALKTRGCDLSESYVKIISSEAYLVNANIPIEGKKDYSSTRSRKLLLNRREILSIQTKIKAKKLTLVPTKMYNKRSLRPDGHKGRERIKLEIALAKSKLKFEKKESIKKKDIEREIAQQLNIIN
jgi:SsrA-binding protein